VDDLVEIAERELPHGVGQRAERLVAQHLVDLRISNGQ
jgi:hypothetical protein